MEHSNISKAILVAYGLLPQNDFLQFGKCHALYKYRPNNFIATGSSGVLFKMHTVHNDCGETVLWNATVDKHLHVTFVISSKAMHISADTYIFGVVWVDEVLSCWFPMTSGCKLYHTFIEANTQQNLSATRNPSNTPKSLLCTIEQRFAAKCQWLIVRRGGERGRDTRGLHDAFTSHHCLIVWF